MVGESKFGTSTLNTLSDGTTRQMSDSWINGKVRPGNDLTRLEEAVGPDKADEILRAGYSRELVHVFPDGIVSVQELDTNGYVKK